MNLVWGHDPTVNDWLDRRFGVLVLKEPAVSIGVIDRRGVLVGAFVTTWANDSTAEMHLYGRVSNGTMRQYFRWVFDRCHRLEIHTTKTNKAIKRAAPKFGFKFEGVSKEFYGPGRDALRFYMTANFCRWINGKSVQAAESA